MIDQPMDATSVARLAALSGGPSVGLEPGTRLLVAGDGGFAWSSGFTQPYDPEVVAQWQDVFAG